METTQKRNRLTFGIGTIGRDMVYALISMALIYYLTDVLELPSSVMWWIGGIILVARIFDALTDPLMGFIVDNTNTRWGKFKPWIAVGAVCTTIFTVLIFTDLKLEGTAFIISFGILYVMWGIAFTLNDIPYWSMLPSLSVDQKERERIGSIARICANGGLFVVVACYIPITNILGERFGSLQKGFFALSVIIVLIMSAGLCVTLFGVKEVVHVTKRKSTSLRELFGIIYKNDQLLFTAIAMSLFMIGYVTTTSFGIYFFKYAYGDEGMFPIFSVILGVSQITALAIFPLFSKEFDRKTLYTAAIVLVVAGYLIFFFSPVTTIELFGNFSFRTISIEEQHFLGPLFLKIQHFLEPLFLKIQDLFGDQPCFRISPILFIGIAGVFIFVGEAFVQLLMLMFLADSVDYGHWKLGKRNDSISFSLQPFINKIGAAISGGVVTAVIILSGINDAKTAADVTAGGLWLMKTAMLIFPLLCIVGSYIIYRTKYKIDAAFYAQIMEDLRKKGELEV